MLPELIGDNVHVECADGRFERYVNLDYAASTPVMVDVWEAVEAFVPWCSSVHRGTGAKSQVSTAAFEDAREDVKAFVGAPPEHQVVFVRNTTEAINVLAAALPDGSRVLTTPVEHHANMLPWRRHDVRMLPFTRSPAELLEACECALREAPADLLAVTGASNVTGEIWPLAEIAEIAHRYGAELFADAAQLVAHQPVDMAAAGVDHLAFSGHKLYAPLGAGALVGRLGDSPPLLHGGGAVKLVTLEEVVWADAPERHEAGSPNVIGVVALAAACRRLRACGMDVVAAHERRLAEQLWDGLEEVPGLRVLRLWPGDSVPRVGLATFTLEGQPDPRLAAILSAEHAIGVRHGCFCAHPLLTRLLGISEPELSALRRELRAGRRPPLPGAVRASLGLGTTAADVDRLLCALRGIAVSGPRRRYRHIAERDEYELVPVTRPMGDVHRSAAA